MKRTIFSCLSAIALFSMFACSQAPDSDKAKVSDAKEVTDSISNDTWTINPTTSKIEWIGTKVSGYHVGSVPLQSGEVQVLNNAITGGKFVMDMSNMTVTGPEGTDQASNEKLLTHLKSPDFFDVGSYPEARFEITKVEAFSGKADNEPDDPRQADINQYKVENPTHTVSGNLTLKNTTKNIQFPAQITMTADSVSALAKFNINRYEWDIKYAGKPDDLIRKEIHLGILLKAKK